MSTLATNAITDASGGNTATINSYTPTESNMAGRNRIINGDMRIDQRNAGASVTVSSGSTSYPVDRMLGYVETGSSGSFTAQRSTVAPVGFTNSLLLTTATADSSITTSEGYSLQHRVEGFNVADLGWGAAGAQSVTLSFWVRSSLTGTFAGSVTNGSFNRAYVFNFTISAANTFEYKTITIPGDTAGTWNTSNGIGLIAYWSLGAGSSLQQTAGSWGSFGYATSGAVSPIATSGATFYITGVQLEAGSVATPVERRQYGQEVALCQRYYYSMQSMTNYPAFHYNFSAYTNVILPVTMRTTPTVTANGIGSTYYEAGTLHTFTVVNFAGQNTQSVSLQVSVSGGTSGFAGTFYPVFQASAEL